MARGECALLPTWLFASEQAFSVPDYKTVTALHERSISDLLATHKVENMHIWVTLALKGKEHAWKVSHVAGQP